MTRFNGFAILAAKLHTLGFEAFLDCSGFVIMYSSSAAADCRVSAKLAVVSRQAALASGTSKWKLALTRRVTELQVSRSVSSKLILRPRSVKSIRSRESPVSNVHC